MSDEIAKLLAEDFDRAREEVDLIKTKMSSARTSDYVQRQEAVELLRTLGSVVQETISDMCNTTRVYIHTRNTR